MVRSALPLLLASLSAPASAQLALQPGETLLEVQAEGRTKFRPDAAFINIGVVSTGATAQEATDANARQMAAVIKAVRGAGVPERYVRTRQISVQPRFERRGPQDGQGQPRISGYVANNGVAVTVTDLARASDVIGAAFGAGANSVDGPNLGTLDPERGVADARGAALANARAEAETYAAGLGMRVARVIRVSERGNDARPVDFVTVSGSRVGSFASAPPPPPAEAPPIAGGEIERTATIWIDYALLPR